MCNLCIDTGPQAPNGTVLGLTFCCHCPDVLNHILTRGPVLLFYFISVYVVCLARESYSRIESDTGEELTVAKMMTFYTIVIGRAKVCLYFHFPSLYSVYFLISLTASYCLS